jgi:hypothetical protein
LKTPVINSFALRCHPLTPQPAVLGSRVEVLARGAGPVLHLRYLLDGDLAQLRIPAAASVCRAHELWHHTCFEAFFFAAESSNYQEFNFSPSRAWAAYQFASYRQQMQNSVLTLEPKIQVVATATQLTLEVAVPRSGRWLGLTAVIEALDGTCSYWALQHLPGQADFHRRELASIDLNSIDLDQ